MRLLTLLLAAVLVGLALVLDRGSTELESLAPSPRPQSAQRPARQAPEAWQRGDRPGAGGEASVGSGPASTREPVAATRVSIDLRLVHAATGEPLTAGSTGLQLWQLGLAEDATWTAGDRQVFDGYADAGCLILEDLEPGTYRAWVHDARLGSEAPPAFELLGRADGLPQVVTWPVTPAEDEPIWLVCVDEHGAPLSRVQRRSRARWYQRRNGQGGPDWARERGRKDQLDPGFGIAGGFGGGGGYRSSSGDPWRDLRSEPEGLSLGRELRQDSRRTGRTWTQPLRRPDGSPVSVIIEPRGANRFLVALPDRRPLLERLVLPDEALRERAEEALALRVRALALWPERSEAQAWTEVVVTILLDLDGCQPIELDWRPAREPLPLIQVLPEAG